VVSASGALAQPTSTTAGDKGGGQKPPVIQTPGARAGLAVFAVIAIVAVSVVAFKAYNRLPADSILRLSSTFSGGGDSGGSAPFSGQSALGAKFISAEDLSPAAVAAGEAAAAAMGGLFAGFMRPGTSQVRPPQVITRTAQPEMLMALSDLDASGMGGANSLSGLSERNSRSGSGASLGDDEGGDIGAAAAGHVPGMIEPGLIGADRRPKVDLIVCMDASGSLSWSEYRSAKEAFTRPGGLLDSVMSAASEGSRIAFVEYAYDSVVVSELDDNVDRVKRRVLSAFQGDANNWERDSLYIYEVDEVYGGNALRKVNSLQRVARSWSDENESATGRTGDYLTSIGSQERSNKNDSASGSGTTSAKPLSSMASQVASGAGSDNVINGEELPSIANACEVPPAMNGLSRDAYLALKWSRLEMLPPLANRELERKVQRANRLRRVLIVNAGEFTDGGSVDAGLISAKEQADEMESRGIAVITVGIGCGQDPGLELLATGDPAAHFSVETTDDLEIVMSDVIHMVLSPRFQPSQSKRLQEPAKLFFKNKVLSRLTKSTRTRSRGSGGDKLRSIRSKMSPKSKVPRHIRSMDSLDDDDDIDVVVPTPRPPRLSEGRLFRNESDLPPWFRTGHNL
jgi:hypothetical protein